MVTSKQDLVRQKLEAKVFNAFGKTVTLIKDSTPIYNNRGELEDSTEVESSIVTVPYNFMKGRLSYQPFGDLKEGESDMAVPYTVDIAVKDQIEMEGQRYKVVNLEENPLPDNTVTIIRISKINN